MEKAPSLHVDSHASVPSDFGTPTDSLAPAVQDSRLLKVRIIRKINLYF